MIPRLKLSLFALACMLVLAPGASAAKRMDFAVQDDAVFVNGLYSGGEVGFQLASMPVLRLTLRNPDFTTAGRIAQVINAAFPGSAIAENPTIVAIRTPAGQNMMSFIGQVENLSVEPDAPAKVVIDEVAGVIVMGENVRVSTVAIQQGNLTITVKESSQVSQPTAFSRSPLFS